MKYLLPVLLLLTGCGTTGVTIPPAPRWVQPAGREFDAITVIVEVAKVAPQATTTYTDSIYTPLSHEWVKAYTSWTWHAAKAVGLRYTPESFDCDNFAGLFAEVARKKAADVGVHTAPLIARVSFLLPDGSAHAVVGVATDKGLFIIEPQPDAGPFRITPLAEFTGRIYRVEL